MTSLAEEAELSGSLPLYDLLDFDERLTFVVRYEIDHGLVCAFANAALRALPIVLAAIQSEVTRPSDDSTLKSWLTHGASRESHTPSKAFTFQGRTWDICSRSSNWLMVSARLGICQRVSDGTQVGHGSLSVQVDANTTVPVSRGGSDGTCSGEYPQERYECRHATLVNVFDRIAHVGIICITLQGTIRFANNHWYELTRHPRDDKSALSWTQVFEDEDIPRVTELWSEVIRQNVPVLHPAKLKRRWQPPAEHADAGLNEPTWILYSGNADWENGSLVGASVCIVDISLEKWLEKKQSMLRDQAVSRASLLQQIATKTDEAAASESRFRKLADNIAVGVYVAELDAKISYANPQYWIILGIDPSTEHEKIWLTAMDEDQLARAAEAFKHVFVDKIPTGAVEVRLKRTYVGPETISSEYDPGGTTYAWALFQAFPELNSDGSLKSVMGCVTDISHQKYMEGFFRWQKEEATTARVQQEKFMDMTSHELRNPLAAILHCAEEIEEALTLNDANSQQPLSPNLDSTVAAARTIVSCSQHARRIMDDVLTFSKMRSLLLKIVPIPCEPTRVFDHALATFRGDITVSQAHLEFTVHDSINTLKVDWVMMDTGRFLQILTNLVSNAIKFVRSRSHRRVHVILAASTNRVSSNIPTEVRFLPEKKTQAVTLEVDPEENKEVFIHVAVQDTGTGIAEEEQTKLFGRFYQASHRTHINYGGSGLGLCISKKLCELQGGQIGFQSELDIGSTFCFYIRTTRIEAVIPVSDPPITLGKRRSPEAQYSSLPFKNRRSSFTTKHPSLPTCSYLDVLVVEDNLVNQQLLTRQLEKQGIGIMVANNGLEALAIIRGSEHWIEQSRTPRKLSLILLDIEMPVMDGLTCIREIRRLEMEKILTLHIPVIAMTANARDEQIVTALEAGMDRILTKPFHFRDLIATMQELVSE